MKRFGISIFCLLMFVSCTKYPEFDSKVPGLFLFKDDFYIRIEQVFYPPQDTEDLTMVNPDRELFVFYPMKTTDSVTLTDMQTGELLQIQLERLEENFYVISHPEPLPVGINCLEISENMSKTGEYPQWCFLVEE